MTATQLDTHIISEDDFISETEAAQIQRIGQRTARLRRSQGEGPDFIKLGRTVLYRRSTVLAYLADLERPANRLGDTDAGHAV